MKVLLCIDFINDILHERGKLAGKGYPEFARSRGVLEKIAELQRGFRSDGLPIVHIRVGFDPSYKTQPKQSPLFGRANEFGALARGSWGTSFFEACQPEADELVMEKPRVGAFYGTQLESTLRTIGATELFVCGVATDLAVSNTVREAHDRDFLVTVLSDACVAANAEDHDLALRSLTKIAKVLKVLEVHAS